MSATEADRENAREIRRRMEQVAGWPNRDATLAEALADEREKARAPFLALWGQYNADALHEHYAGHTLAHEILTEVYRTATGQQ